MSADYVPGTQGHGHKQGQELHRSHHMDEQCQKVKLLRTNARLRSTSLNATVAVRKEGRRGKDRAEAQVLRCMCLADLRLDSQQRRKEGQKKRRKQTKVGGKVTLEEVGPFGGVPLPIPKPKQDRHHQRRFLL